MLDVIISFVTVAGALPLGILLALGRRSQLPVMQVLFDRLHRAVARRAPADGPLHVGRHGAAVPALRRQRRPPHPRHGGLHPVQRRLHGRDGARRPAGRSGSSRRRPPIRVGLKWWQVQVFVTLPQALRIVVPGIVNNIVDLFKDTSLVTIIGLVDLLGAVNQSLKDPAWLGLAKEGYVFTAFVFFVCCFGMSSYSRRFERRLNRHRTGATLKIAGIEALHLRVPPSSNSKADGTQEALLVRVTTDDGHRRSRRGGLQRRGRARDRGSAAFDAIPPRPRRRADRQRPLDPEGAGATCTTRRAGTDAAAWRSTRWRRSTPRSGTSSASIAVNPAMPLWGTRRAAACAPMPACSSATTLRRRRRWPRIWWRAASRRSNSGWGRFGRDRALGP